MENEFQQTALMQKIQELNAADNVLKVQIAKHAE